MWPFKPKKGAQQFRQEDVDAQASAFHAWLSTQADQDDSPERVAAWLGSRGLLDKSAPGYAKRGAAFAVLVAARHHECWPSG